MIVSMAISQPRQSSLHIAGRTSGAVTAPARAAGQRSTKSTQFCNSSIATSCACSQLLSVCLSVCLSLCLSICLAVCLSLVRTLFCLPASCLSQALSVPLALIWALSISESRSQCHTTKISRLCPTQVRGQPSTDLRMAVAATQHDSGIRRCRRTPIR